MTASKLGVRPLVISAPFGEWRSYPWATPTVGTYTCLKRAGWGKRWWKVLTTVRPIPRVGGWVNDLGLPNPGIKSLLHGKPLSRKILSVYGTSRDEWLVLSYWCSLLRPLAVEVNLSCPNVDRPSIKELVDGCLFFHDRLRADDLPVIAKLSPVNPMAVANPLFKGGVRNFHLCNSLPTPGGGLSGKPLKPLSLWAVRAMKDAHGPLVTVVGGGGITTRRDVQDYYEAGAQHVAVGSALLNPFRGRGWLSDLAHYAERLLGDPEESCQHQQPVPGACTCKGEGSVGGWFV